MRHEEAICFNFKKDYFELFGVLAMTKPKLDYNSENFLNRRNDVKFKIV